MNLGYEPAGPETRPEAHIRVDLIRRLLAARVVFVSGPLKEPEANTVMAQLLHLEADSARDIHLYINSPGGSSAATLAIYDTIQCVRPEVATVCVGEAAGGAAVILAAGTPGKRYALPNARVWVQQPHTEYMGQPSDIDIRAREVLRQRRLIDEILARHTGKPVADVAADTDRDLIMSAHDALAYGIVDEVILTPGLPHRIALDRGAS